MGFFDPASMAAIASAGASIAPLVMGGGDKPDQFAQQQRLQQESQATQQVEGARNRAMQAAQAETNQIQSSNQQRAEALNRIIGQFQTNLQI